MLPAGAALVERASDLDAYVNVILAARRASRTVAAPPACAQLIPRLWCLLAKYGGPEDAPDSPRGAMLFLIGRAPADQRRRIANLIRRLRRCEVSVALLEEPSALNPSRIWEDAGARVTFHGTPEVLDRAESLLELIQQVNAGTVLFCGVDAETKLVLAKVLECRSIKLLDGDEVAALEEQLARSAPFQKRICLSARQYLRRVKHIPNASLQACLGFTGWPA